MEGIIPLVLSGLDEFGFLFPGAFVADPIALIGIGSDFHVDGLAREGLTWSTGWSWVTLTTVISTPDC